jgi:hypothetical protein
VLPKTHDAAKDVEAVALVNDAYQEWSYEAILDQMDWGYGDAPFPERPHFPDPKITECDVVYLSEASAMWLDEVAYLDFVPAWSCWVEAEVVPAWWAKSRKHKAFRLDCCSLQAPELAAVLK